MTESENSFFGPCWSKEDAKIANYILNSLCEVFGIPSTDALIRQVYDPGTPIEFWCLEAVAKAYDWANENFTLTPEQKAELCSLLWNERMTVTCEGLDFEPMALCMKPDVIEAVWEYFSDLLDARIMP